MRVVEEIVHPACKVTIFSWNEKYLIKFEQDVLEQTYKVSEMDITGMDDIRTLAQSPFIDKVLTRFDTMRQDLYETLEALY